MTICQLGILNSQITSLVCEQAPGITPDDSLARVRLEEYRLCARNTWSGLLSLGVSIVFFVLFFVVVIVSNIGTLLVQWSLTIKPAALVFSLEGFQSLFVFCLAIIAAKFSPKFIAESTSPKNLLVKFLAFFY